MMADDVSFQPILLSLPSLTPSLAAEILPFGLTLHRLFLQADGRTHDLVVGPEDPAGHKQMKYTNTVIGRYTNRVPTGTHIISRNGISTKIEPKATAESIPRVSLHGGPSGFDQLAFEPIPLDVVEAGPMTLFTASEISELQVRFPQGAGILFRAISPDGDQGYPGRLFVEAVVGLLQAEEKPADSAEYLMGSVVFIYRAKLLDDGVVTPVNLTQHWGFNLDASLKEGPESLSVKGHRLTIAAPHTVVVDNDGLPTGELASTAGTAHAHKSKIIGEQFPEASGGNLGAGYDHFYVFEKRDLGTGAAAKHRFTAEEFTPDFNAVADVLKPGAADGVVELGSDKSGIRLVFGTNQSGVQFYSYNFAKADGARKRIHGGTGAPGPGAGYPAGSAVFLEFHEPLASFLYPGSNPSGDDTILAPGEIYNNYVRADVLYRTPNPL